MLIIIHYKKNPFSNTNDTEEPERVSDLCHSTGILLEKLFCLNYLSQKCLSSLELLVMISVTTEKWFATRVEIGFM